MKKENTIESTLTEMEELVLAQDRALKTADSLLLLKDCMIDILEEQKRLQDKNIKQLQYCLIGIIVCDILLFITSYCYAS
jgi:hypothetical protein